MTGQLVDTEGLGAHLGGTSPWTIRHWRSTGAGPKGVRVGRRVLYRLSDVDRWLDEKAAADRLAQPTEVSA